MYAGLILTKHSGSWLGAHQRFNRMAFRVVLPEIEKPNFPSLKSIQHFEGKNGPDGLKRKSSAKDEPAYFYNPKLKKGDVKDEVANHYRSLVNSMRDRNGMRAAFEASWLAHSITDGLTPAHHYPYADELQELRSHNSQMMTKFRDRAFVRGSSKSDTVRKTWQLIGVKGLLSTHVHFELGVAAAVSAARYNLPLDRLELQRARQIGPLEFFKEQAGFISELDLYRSFHRNGWTINLARLVRRVLAPTIAQTIAIIWLLAYEEAGYSLRSDRLRLVWT